MEDILQFLIQLTKNNNREWFAENKAWYQQCREKMFFLVDLLISEIRKFDPEIPVTDPAENIFRIYRDVRFSKDKSPYKTHFGGFISKGGRNSRFAGYYIHIASGDTHAGGGLYMPEKDDLKAIRQHILQYPDEFTGIINDPGFRKVFPEMLDHRLKTAPRGFPKDHPQIDLLRYKSFAFSTHFMDEELVGEAFIENTVAAFRHLHPVNSFLNEALENR